MEQLRGGRPFDDLKPVKKFTDRKAAVARIWKAVQRLATNAAPQGAPDAPKAKGPTKKATSTKKGALANQGAKEARNGSKKATVLDLMRRAKGASLAEIMEATGWQAHYADVRIMPTCVGNPACGAVIAAMESA